LGQDEKLSNWLRWYHSHDLEQTSLR